MSWRRPVRLLARRLARHRGYDLVEYPSDALRRRLKLLRHHGVDLILDVGADTGEYVTRLRRHGYAGHVVSFEPLASSYAELCRHCAADPLWEAVNMALGDRDGQASLNVAANAHSSSLRGMLAAHVKAAPHSAYVGVEEVRVRRLDTVFAEYRRAAARVFLKVDVQGGEREVLAGAEQAMSAITGVQLEMSLVPLYEGQALFGELLEWMTSRGLVLMSLEPGFTDPRSGQLLQVDGVFFRNERH